MFSFAYVVLPFSDTPPADAIRASLARFERGMRGDVPDDWLRFEDETGELRAMHEERLSLSLAPGLTLHDATHSWHLDFKAVRAEMEARGRTKWEVRLCDIEPDFDRFVERFSSRDFERHPVTQGYGFWRNGLGEWDYWELGGRFDGRISGEQGQRGRKKSAVSSGPSVVRDMIGSIEDRLCDAFEQERPTEVDVRNDDNIELVSCLIEDQDAAEATVPGVVVLPPEAVSDGLRWLKNWPHRGPCEAIDWLGLSTDAEWRNVVRATLARFPDHWAAGVAFHH